MAKDQVKGRFRILTIFEVTYYLTDLGGPEVISYNLLSEATFLNF